MVRFGRYDPQNSENASTLFVYQEVPVASAKLNRWDGNIAAGFELLHRIMSELSAKGAAAVITSGGSGALQVAPADPPNGTVRVQPGWAVFDGGFAGVAEKQSLPAGGAFAAPVNAPRIDLIVLTSAGALEIVEGVEAESPAPPDAPGEALALAQIYLRVGASQILAADDGVQSYIIDVRPRFLLGEAHSHQPDRAPGEAPDGYRTQFFTRHVFRADSLDVYVNGVLQQAGVDYCEDPGRRSYTFVSPPAAHYRIQHRYLVDYEAD
ncbi:MAG: hypothetical protein JXR73_04125 [Candidatus Omnitrophica bacterium]|nr:hypothetical protein [Candidatus Omnitrophota bacterium]